MVCSVGEIAHAPFTEQNEDAKAVSGAAQDPDILPGPAQTIRH